MELTGILTKNTLKRKFNCLKCREKIAAVSAFTVNAQIKRFSMKREGIYVYLWMIHVEVQQKTAKFCKAIILQ